MTLYSHSRISCFETCPKQYSFKYIEKPKIEKKIGIEAFMGSRVHDALEKLYKDLKLTKRNSLSDLLRFYEMEWKKNWSDSIEIVKEGFTQEHYFNLGKKCIESYYRAHQPFFGDKTIACEKRVCFSLDEAGKYKLVGFIDRLAEKTPGHYVIHDYKTAGRLPSQEEKDNDRQLALYSIALYNDFADCVDVNLAWHYLRFNKEIHSRRSGEQLAALKKETIAAIQKIEKAAKKNDFPARESALCAWCSYRELCPLKKHEFKTSALSAKEFKKDEGVKLVERYIELNGEIKKLKLELDELTDRALAYAQKFDLQKIAGKDAALKVWKRSGYSFAGLKVEQKQEIQEILKRAGLLDKFLELNTRGLGSSIEKGELGKPLSAKLKKFVKETESKGVKLAKK